MSPQILIKPAADPQSLIQISGRVGRDKKYYYGEVIFLANKKTKEMEEAIDEISFQNEHLHNLS